MDKKIKIQVFGREDKELPSLCGCSGESDKSCDRCHKSSSNNCSGCKKNKETDEKKLSVLRDAIINLRNFFLNSDVKDNVVIEYIDLDSSELKSYPKVKDIIDKGFEAPITVIDDIVRYYGGISNFLVYKDVKELLE